MKNMKPITNISINAIYLLLLYLEFSISYSFLLLVFYCS